MRELEGPGFAAELYLPHPADHPPGRAVALVVSGSSGGLAHRSVAQEIARLGFPAAALAYFAHPGLPPRLAAIELESFARAAERIRSEPVLRDAPIVLIGRSRGAELALELAATFDHFDGVVAASPSSVRWGAVGGPGPAWILRGEPVPFVEPVGDTTPPHTEINDGRAFASYAGWYEAQLGNSPSARAAEIPIERFRGRILLLWSRSDQLWPSATFAAHLVERARKHGRGELLESIELPDLGHVIPFPGETHRSRVWIDAIGSGLLYGGDPGAARRAAPAIEHRLIDLLRRASSAA